ncbi:DegT/DnrJ/EryC1/StrS family aminotransferase [Candidatus Saccharibacteria bacterium]|nr:DegT/DnrJ/EryC1/StrS family aminotransferase [Candidatus Saccharibacteria bacterium]
MELSEKQSPTNIALRKKLASLTDTDYRDWFLCLKARYGMAVVFQSIFDTYGSGDIITSPYTCITAVNPILAGHLRPLYADIFPENLQINPESAKTILTERTYGLVMQHTLGIIGDKQSLISFAKEHKLLLIEDSAHCLTRCARDKQQSIVSDISIHSFGVEKILTGTKFGGAVYLNPRLKNTHKALYDRLITHFRSLPAPSSSLAFRLKTYRYQNAVLQRLPHSVRPSLRNFLIKAKLLEPAIYPEEQEGQQASPVASNQFVEEVALSNIKTLKSNYHQRSQNVAYYHSHLNNHPSFDVLTNVNEPLLAYPILFKSAASATSAYAALNSSGFFIRRWYSPLLFPGPTSNRIYHYHPRSLKIAESIHPRVLCLPTDLTKAQLEQIVKILKPSAPVENAVENIDTFPQSSQSSSKTTSNQPQKDN